MKRVLFFIIVILLGIALTGYALNLDKLKAYILNADYKSAISEGERLIAASGHDYRSDELYYLLGVSYLKNGNYLRASDIFEIILKEFNDSPFRDAARLGLGDTYFLREDYQSAKESYRRLITDSPHSELKAAVYYRLSRCAARTGDSREAADYQNKLRQEFPSSPEVKLDTAIGASGNFYYTVQAGSFLNSTNANNLIRRLQEEGYLAYLEEACVADKSVYRVKVGKFSSRQEAIDLENKLSREGYPTKICP